MWCFIQARSTSERLPNKCMADIGGYPMIHHVVERCRSVMDNVAVLVPYEDPLIDWCKENSVEYFDGPEEDVLERYMGAVIKFNAKGIIRITGDCPLIPPTQINAALNRWNDLGFDFYSNLPTVDGWDVEAMSYDALLWTYQNAVTKYDKEHVTTYFKDVGYKSTHWKIHLHSEPVMIGWFPKLSVDTQEDLDRIRGIYEKLTSSRLYNI